MSETATMDPIIFTTSAASKVSEMIAEEGDTNLKLRVYVTGGGCSGFQYSFAFDDQVGDDRRDDERGEHDTAEGAVLQERVEPDQYQADDAGDDAALQLRDTERGADVLQKLYPHPHQL